MKHVDPLRLDVNPVTGLLLAYSDPNLDIVECAAAAGD